MSVLPAIFARVGIRTPDGLVHASGNLMPWCGARAAVPYFVSAASPRTCLACAARAP